MKPPAPPRSRRPAALAALFTASAALLSGCVVAPVEPRGMAYSQAEYVDMQPPAPMYEQVGPPPVVGYVWITGYWLRHLGRYSWMGGHWAAPPRGGARWAPHRWERGNGGWRLHEGHWR